ncbi:uncharacterized protein PGTG_21420 [Puccinia graminis f. sp. tritici CRL 75-36-700-3]|uniref:Uncharacterized protein n=1 Tax=Puccinia graminis f. sp. tritici (strain CRL 75-36-700-3 / race SCCL) TaxID=418459 RepID=H6QR99_PUCGT|nr:uncharacterized protein PGTG_21420 [Puccinia graminis f. sp. tritici CRL 75-36-700-3]EHS63090.1 hypothetical protein PGTG_21420 [Puccinia graminis f. sp. tritici CRL 75-36-700-3]
MYFLFSSSNPETIELFRSTYYRPKLGLWILLFILFPPINRTNNTKTTTTITVLPTTTHTTTTEPITTTTPTATTHPSCPDAYRDHRNNLICPHAPKRLKSVRQRFSQVLLEFQISINRLISSQEDYQQQLKELEKQQQQQLQHHHHHQPSNTQKPKQAITLSSLPRLIICTPLANPFLHLLIILHILLSIQAISLLIEDALIKDACFSGPTNYSFFRRSASSWPKLWSRIQFRLRNQWSQPAFLEPFSLWLLLLGLLIFVASETLGEPGSWSRGGLAWDDLPFRTRCGWSSSSSSSVSETRPFRCPSSPPHRSSESSASCSTPHPSSNPPEHSSSSNPASLCSVCSSPPNTSCPLKSSPN